MFSTIVISPSSICCAEIAIAAARAGEVGVLHLGFGPVRQSQLAQWRRLESSGRAHWGIRWDRSNGTLQELTLLLEESGTLPYLLILQGFDVAEFSTAHLPKEVQIYADVCSIDSARRLDSEVCGLILSGNEAGGLVGRDASYIMLQKAAQAKLKSPYFIRGGVGPDTAAAAVESGAAGVVLEEQLWLSRENSFEPAIRNLWQSLDGSETECVGGDEVQCRVFSRTATSQIQIFRDAITREEQWLDSLLDRLGDRKSISSEKLIALGQDIAFASELAAQHGSVAGIISHFKRRMRDNIRLAVKQESLIGFSDFAKTNGSEFPILQGPMTRVSDVPQFAADVQANGAIPFLALSLMKGKQVSQLLKEAQPTLQSGSWGVGILGFVPNPLRDEQIRALRQFKPTHAIIAGGRPTQALELESEGISTFLHVPSPGLLCSFYEAGCRKFIFEGRECGGHVGPRSSFLIWQTAVSFFERLGTDDLTDVELVFAGGIHDALSAAMVAVITAPLVKRGAKVAVLMGTAYLFTDEAVSSGAIQMEFQQQALRCDHTALLDSGNGHQTRAAHTPFVSQFQQKKQELLLDGKTLSESRQELEMLNIGRLRIAAKGVQRVGTCESSELVTVSASDQLNGGLYMIGDVATMGNRVRPMRSLHQAVTSEAQEFLEASEGSKRNCSHHDLTVQAGEPWRSLASVVFFLARLT